ncbi:MAG: cytochrome c [Granulosicoccus sp.]|nr:cytochrome c [Granulosicoccus sp.]
MNKRIRQIIYFVPLFIGLSPVGFAVAGDQPNGKDLAKQCSTCHGKDGIATDPLASNLAGQPAIYLEKTLKDYRSGARQDPRMSFVAQTLDDDQIKALAEWYSSFKVEVIAPE